MIAIRAGVPSVLLLVTFGWISAEPGAAAEPQAAVEDGYRSLFDGSDLSHWEGAGRPAEKCWEVRDNTIVGLKQKGPWLRSKEEYDDFNLRLEYQVEPGANSGVYIRVPADGNHHRDTTAEATAGFEIQILDDAARKYGKLKDYQYCGSLYNLAGAARRVAKPAGEWNTLEIDCQGQHVTVVHNGVKIVEVTSEQFPLIELRKTSGYLGLQNHGGGVRFRNIRIGPPLGDAAGESAATDASES